MKAFFDLPAMLNGEDRTAQEVGAAVGLYDGIQKILDACLSCMTAEKEPEQALRRTLECLGTQLKCDRVSVFELNDSEGADNTYEWCAPGVNPQQSALQDISLTDIGYWFDQFRDDEAVIIENIEQIRERYPLTYSILKPQGIASLVACGLQTDGKITGLLGVENSNAGTNLKIAPVLKLLSPFLSAQIKRRDMLVYVREQDMRDGETGAYNLQGLRNHEHCASRRSSMGIIACDLNMTDDVNAEVSTEALRECFGFMRHSLDTRRIYRISRTEFMAVYPDTAREKLQKDTKMLRAGAVLNDCPLAVGYAWSDEQPMMLEPLLNRAARMMRLDKRKEAGQGSVPEKASGLRTLLTRYLKKNYSALSFFLTAITRNNRSSYFFFGDMKENIFYISDNLRDRFGFESNVVPDLLNVWAEKIENPQSRERYWNDINRLTGRKQNVHNLYYQVVDAKGKNVWIHCYGELQWNEDHTQPLFFAGRITKQDEIFSVDSVTNLPWENVLVSHLNALKFWNRGSQAIGFSLNNITQINSLQGREYGNRLIRCIVDELMEQLSSDLAFYRISGMRCMALTKEEAEGRPEDYVRRIREIIEKKYEEFGVSVNVPCSFAVMQYPQKNLSALDFLENMASMIKVAQQEWETEYIDDQNTDVRRIQDTSGMTLQLSRDVLNGMQNFRVVVQPVVSTEGECRIIGGETLLRWRYEGKDISPEIFIRILEEENMIQKAGRWVFEEATRACMRMLAYIPDFYLTVNVSLEQLHDEGFADFIGETMKKYHMGKGHIIVEMTESCMDKQPDKLHAFVAACKNYGINIALDDFGTGYSSLRVLLQYPSTIIKLERSLLLEMGKSADKMNFISSIVYACHRFGKKVCMEGVETEIQDAMVKESCCDMIQGFYYYRPMELKDVYKLLARGAAAKPTEQ